MNSGLEKVAVYSRVSTQEQVAEGTSLNYQSEQAAPYCKSQGWEIVQSYSDPGFTGKDENRPGLKRLLADAKLGLFTKVAVLKLDRLSRNLRLLLELEEKLKANGVSLYSIKESIDTSTAIGHTVFQVLGLVSEWEREAIVERTKAGRLQRYKEGCWGPGSPPYGYDYNKETKKLVVDKAEAKTVHRVFVEYSSGKSMTQIANMLNGERIPPRNPKKGKGWRNTSVRDVLFDSVYKGTLIVNVQQLRKSHSRELPETAIRIQVPAIVDEVLWNIAQERRKNNKHLQPSRNGQWLLQGLVTCGLCGHSFRTEMTHDRRAYSCRGRLKYTHIDGSPRCTSPRLDAEWLEGQVWRRIEDIINDPSSLEKLLKETVDNLREREADLNARIQPINKRLSEIAEEKARLAEDWVQRSVSPSRLQELKRGLEQEEGQLKSVKSEIDPAQLEELERTSAMLKFWQKQLQALDWDTETEDGRKIRTVDKPHQTVLTIVGLDDQELSRALHFPATRRELLDLLQVRVVVFEDRIEVKAIFPFKPIDYQLLCSGCKSIRCPQSQ
jgi:site-specific DNA recombinase